MVGQTVRLIGCGTFLLFMFYVSQPGTSLFSWHPFLMALAFTGFMTEALFTFSKSGLASAQPHSTKVTTHWLLLAATATAHLLGVAAIYNTKEANNKPHFTSWHGCLGCLAAVLLWVQLSGGIFSKYPQLVGSIVPLKRLRKMHSLSGSVAYALAILVLILSLGTAWYKNNAPEWSVYPVLALHLGLIYAVFKRHFSKYSSASK